MLMLKIALDFNDFKKQFSDELEGFSSDEPIRIIYDALCDLISDGDWSVQAVSDFLTYQMDIKSLNDMLMEYDDLDEYRYDDLDNDELIKVVREYIISNTYLLGSYEYDGQTFFIFDAF